MGIQQQCVGEAVQASSRGLGVAGKATSGGQPTPTCRLRGRREETHRFMLFFNSLNVASLDSVKAARLNERRL